MPQTMGTVVSTLFPQDRQRLRYFGKSLKVLPFITLKDPHKKGAVPLRTLRSM